MSEVEIVNPGRYNDEMIVFSMEKIRVPLCRSRTYDLPITSSDALPLRYRGLVSDDSGILGKKSEYSFTAKTEIVQTVHSHY